MNAVLCLLLFFVIPHNSANDDILADYGIRLKVPNKGLEFITDYIERSLKKLLSNPLPIPDHTEDFFGGHFTLYNASVMSIGEISLTLNASFFHGIAIKASLKSVHLRGEYDYSLIGFPSSGWLDVKGEDISLNVSMVIPDLKPRLELLTCKSEGDIDLEFDGWFDTINNGVIKLFKNIIWNIVYEEVCDAIESNIGKLSDSISENIPETVEFNNIVIDLRMSDNVFTYRNIIDFFLEGYSYVKGKQFTISNKYSKKYFENSSEDDKKMVYLYITSETISQFAETAHDSGSLNINLTEEVMPGPIKILLKTMPSFIKDAPKNGQTIINLKSSKLPVVKVENDFLYLDILGTLTVLYNTSSDLMVIASYNLDLSASAQLTFEDNTLKFEIKTLKTYFYSQNSILDYFSKMLETAMRFIDPVIMPMLNVWGRVGFHIDFPLPKEISLKNTSVELRKNGVVFSADFAIDTSLLSDVILEEVHNLE